MYLYHATEREYALSIKKNGFRVKRNKEHWLGHGVYFYADWRMAEWWATARPEKFGGKIVDPCIIRAYIEESELNIINLSVYLEYYQFLSRYAEFERGAIEYLKGDKPVGLKEYQCAYMEYYARVRQADAMVAGFLPKNQPYLPSRGLLDTIKRISAEIPFIEEQICVCPQAVNKITIMGVE